MFSPYWLTNVWKSFYFTLSLFIYISKSGDYFLYRDSLLFSILISYFCIEFPILSICFLLRDFYNCFYKFWGFYLFEYLLFWSFFSTKFDLILMNAYWNWSYLWVTLDFLGEMKVKFWSIVLLRSFPISCYFIYISSILWFRLNS